MAAAFAEAHRVLKPGAPPETVRRMLARRTHGRADRLRAQALGFFDHSPALDVPLSEPAAGGSCLSHGAAVEQTDDH